MKKRIITFIIATIAIMGTTLLAQGASNTENADNQTVSESIKTTIEPQVTPRSLERNTADGERQHYTSGGYLYSYIGVGKGIRLERFSDDSPWKKCVCDV